MRKASEACARGDERIGCFRSMQAGKNRGTSASGSARRARRLVSLPGLRTPASAEERRWLSSAHPQRRHARLASVSTEHIPGTER